MENFQNNIIGLIGGMGPYASSHFYKLLLKKSNDFYGVKNNDDYPEILIDSVPVPDFISDTNKLKVAEKMLISRVKRLNNFGCNTLAMVCNTGHILYPELSKHSQAKFISLIKLVATEAQKKGYKRVGILATKTTIQLGIYKEALSELGIITVNPNSEMQKKHELIIRDVVAGKITSFHKNSLFKMTKDFIKENKLDGVILGCTELPLVFPKDRFENMIDCLDVLSDALLLEYYKNKEKKQHE